MGSVKRNSIEKLRSSLQQRGVSGTIVLTFKNVWWLFRDNLSARRRRRRREDLEFEQRSGIETYGVIPVTELGIAAGAQASANHYEPTPVGSLELILRNLPLAPERFTFIDVGSGMGRAVFVALEFPFRRAIGVELSPMLHEQAERNLEKYRDPRRQCRDCRFWLGDATRFEWPDESIVLYMYNPFREGPMQAVLDNLGAWLSRTGHDLYIIYYNPVHRELLDGCRFLERIKSERSHSVYRGKRA